MHISLRAFLRGVCSAVVMHGYDEVYPNQTGSLVSQLSSVCGNNEVRPQKTTKYEISGPQLQRELFYRFYFVG